MGTLYKKKKEENIGRSEKYISNLREVYIILSAAISRSRSRFRFSLVRFLTSKLHRTSSFGRFPSILREFKFKLDRLSGTRERRGRTKETRWSARNPDKTVDQKTTKDRRVSRYRPSPIRRNRYANSRRRCNPLIKKILDRWMVWGTRWNYQDQRPRCRVPSNPRLQIVPTHRIVFRSGRPCIRLNSPSTWYLVSSIPSFQPSKCFPFAPFEASSRKKKKEKRKKREKMARTLLTNLWRGSIGSRFSARTTDDRSVKFSRQNRKSRMFVIQVFRSRRIILNL